MSLTTFNRMRRIEAMKAENVLKEEAKKETIKVEETKDTKKEVKSKTKITTTATKKE